MHKKITLIYFLLISCIIISCSKDEEPDTTPPTVSFNIAGITQNPASSTPPIVSNSIEVVINAQDAKGINKVEAFIDNTKVGEDNSAPFKIVIDLSSYNSKNSTLIKKTDKIYTLKVTATDKAGNQASTEEEILIDNEAPSITEVSLEENQVISGDENSVTFKATDNQELNTTEAFINDDLAEVTLEDDIYTLNIETTSLNDGENILKITATDKLDNISNHSTTFIVDNTGPEITLANISDGDIVDSLINISPNVSDEYSDIAYIKLLLNETVIDSVAGTENISFDLDPESYSVGNHTIEIVSEDVFKNQSKLSINFEILRVLVRLNIPEDFLSSYDHSFIVFASDNEGELLTTKSLTLNDREITLHAPGEFDKSTSFMLTFAANELFSQNSFSRLATITDINRDNPEAITLKVPLRKTVKTSNIYQTEGFTNADFIHGDGLEYTSSFYHEDLTILIENYAVNSLNNTSNEVYLFSTSLNSQYSYYKTTTPLPEGFILKTSDFINDSYVNTTDFGITTSNQFILNTQLSIKGYNNDDEYNATNIICYLEINQS